jgi:hypothetical protein
VSKLDQQGPDPFDPASLRLDPSETEHLGVKKIRTHVPVRKPNRQDFVRVYANPDYTLAPAGIVEVREDRETYLFTPALARAYPAEVSIVRLHTAINRQGVVFLWPVRLPDQQGRQNVWQTTLLDAAERATEAWVRVVANMSLGAYEVSEAVADIPEPEWPTEPLNELLRIAFKNHIVDRDDHPLLKRLRGEA